MTTNRSNKLSAPALRVSHLTFVRVMSAVIEDTASMSPEDAIAVISAVRDYLSTPCGIPLGAKHDALLRKYRDIIDRAAMRSAKARAASLRRKAAHAETPTLPQPAIPEPEPVIEPEPVPAPEPKHTPVPAHKPAAPKAPGRPRIKIKHKSPARGGHKNFGGPGWSR